MRVEADGFSKGVFLLEVVLPIERGRLHVAEGVLLGGVEEEDVGGDDFAVAYLDVIAGSHLVPLRLHELSLPQDACHSRVDLPILAMSLLRERKPT